jgi:hypothetical protein
LNCDLTNSAFQVVRITSVRHWCQLRTVILDGGFISPGLTEVSPQSFERLGVLVGCFTSCSVSLEFLSFKLSAFIGKDIGVKKDFALDDKFFVDV